MLEACDGCEHKIDRKAHHNDKCKVELVNRFNRIIGQIRGISKMVGEDIYCDDILNQMNSVSAALNGARKVLLEAHLKSCIVEQIQDGKLEVVDELMKTIDKMLK